VVLDTSVLIAILRDEPDASAMEAAMARAVVGKE